MVLYFGTLIISRCRFRGIEEVEARKHSQCLSKKSWVCAQQVAMHHCNLLQFVPEKAVRGNGNLGVQSSLNQRHQEWPPPASFLNALHKKRLCWQQLPCKKLAPCLGYCKLVTLYSVLVRDELWYLVPPGLDTEGCVSLPDWRAPVVSRWPLWSDLALRLQGLRRQGSAWPALTEIILSSGRSPRPHGGRRIPKCSCFQSPTDSDGEAAKPIAQSLQGTHVDLEEF